MCKSDIVPAGIIAEYNPFHNGHAQHIAETRRTTGATHIVAVMSGSFVQRGEPAVLSKTVRAQAAIRCGADLVLELPVVWSCATAEKFAFGGVYLLHALGMIKYISFGSECGEIMPLKTLADIVDSEEIGSLLKRELASGITYAAARQKAVESLAGDNSVLPQLLRHPNNILGVEYIRALERIGSSIHPVAVQRVGAEHDSQTVCNIASAFEIRRRMKAGEPFGEFLPPESREFVEREMLESRAPGDVLRLERAVLACLRTKAPEELRSLPDISEGLEHRIITAVRNATREHRGANCLRGLPALEDLYDRIKTKRYSHARIRRTIMHALLGITAVDVSELPPYLRVLAFNERGKEILRLAAKTASLPIVMKNAAVKPLGEFAHRVFELESRATDFFGLSTPDTLPFGQDYGFKR